MTQKIVNVSEIEGYLRDIENIANVLPIRAILNKAPSVSGEAVAEVIKDTNNMKEIVFNAHHWTHILKVGDKLYTTPQPDIVAELREAFEIVKRQHIHALDAVIEHRATIAELEEKRIMQLSAISTASIGYFKDGDDIHKDYDTVALRDVTNLYVRYTEQSQAIAELVEALERLDGWLEARHLGGLMPNEKALIAKHKK